MESGSLLILLVPGAALVGGAVGWIVSAARAQAGISAAQSEVAVRDERLSGVARERDSILVREAETREELEAVEEDRHRLREALARGEATAEAAQRAEQERNAFVGQASQQLRDAFQALSAEALRGNGQAFLELANQSLGQRQEAIASLVDPLKTSLLQMDENLRELERVRVAAQASMGVQISQVNATQVELQKETARLAGALTAPHSRGRWGELQLRRVVELAGMVGYCDFEEQPLLPGEGRLRPDLVVRLPGGRSLIVDAKAPLDAYLQATNTVGTEREAKLHAHARALREHMKLLRSKEYASRLPRSLEFVLLFLPGEPFLGAALEQDPTLLEFGAEQNVILATPSTLISILRAVAHGWREEQVEQNTREIMAAGRELHDRLGTMADYLIELRRSISGSVEAFNRTVGTLESRVLPSARRMQSLGAGAEPIAEVIPIDKEPRSVALPEPTLFSDPRSGT